MSSYATVDTFKSALYSTIKSPIKGIYTGALNDTFKGKNSCNQHFLHWFVCDIQVILSKLKDYIYPHI